MKKIVYTLTTLSIILLAACTSTPQNHTIAIQKENNLFEVTGLGKTSIIAKNNAINAANKTCGQATTIVVSEKTTYNGVLQGVVDQETGKLIEAATTVIGKISGSNTSIASDDDYQTTLNFQCKGSR
ncbi:MULTISPECIES: hypothetical protein [unclassified Acinetobacter]|uniref:hypothetical protein n=1 Tax=unclassified Acinetobacter TaxID=196816 RepID=UPI002934CBF5|nr:MULTISPECIES: hypothetical protein [unclassified Acinetobacter]WOE31710.1 hypothetical protein QSG84_00290 [Acinetobacter sp. SAAs470]WOE37176.1 hypothetical protein QSG86_09335 [Acinetobacter sp. SAAs474]